MDKYSFIANIKSEDAYADLAVDVETRFNISNHEVDRLLFVETNNKMIGLMKDELGGRIIKESATLRPNMYNYLTNDSCVNKKAKGKKKSVIKHKIKFEENDQIIMNSQQRLKCKAHNVFTEKVNKVA